jgi:asparagine synthetase B (glutamine-hydrolysing)
MNSQQPNTQRVEDAARHGLPRWFAAVGERASVPQFANDLLAADASGKTLWLAHEAGSAPPQCAQREGRTVILDGVLHNGRELLRELRDSPVTEIISDADVILSGYLRWGESLLRRLRGIFALIIHDSVREVSLCLRDPIGTHPLFFAIGTEGLLVSPSIDVLTRHPQVSSEFNRAALADYFLDRFPKIEETFFKAVNRVPAGYVFKFTAQDQTFKRYWDPGTNGQVDWLDPAEVERFDELFEQAVRRCMSLGKAGILLSGGLDSVSVAAMATEHCQRQGLPRPLALSLVFPDPDTDEEIVQRGVASQLGLPQLIKPFFDATGPKGLLTPALDMSRGLSNPLMNNWWPAYFNLVEAGKQRGCDVILTGNGGDEWLTVTPYLAADLWRSLDFAGIYRLWQSLQRSNRQSPVGILCNLTWRFGLQPRLVPPAYRVVKRVAPWSIKLRHRLAPRIPDWVAPDPTLRRELDQRWEDYGAKEHNRKETSVYVGQMRLGLEHPLVALQAEETFEVGSKTGVRILHPFWDADLIDLLFRTPPFLLNRDGRSKGMVRAAVARRFPNLGFERQQKMEASHFYSSLVYNESGSILRQMGRMPTLAKLGIIDGEHLDVTLNDLIATRPRGMGYRIWSAMNLEAWAEAHGK